jgi:protocatechuate 4,5-dioxygenase alpha chain
VADPACHQRGLRWRITSASGLSILLEPTRGHGGTERLSRAATARYGQTKLGGRTGDAENAMHIAQWQQAERQLELSSGTAHYVDVGEGLAQRALEALESHPPNRRAHVVTTGAVPTEGTPPMEEREQDSLLDNRLLHGRGARTGYPLNSMCMSLNDAAAREQFLRDPQIYMQRFGLTEQQQDAVRRRDWRRMSELGGNIYFLIKLAMLDGVSVPELGAMVSGTPIEQFQTMMDEGGRTADG